MKPAPVPSLRAPRTLGRPRLQPPRPCPCPCPAPSRAGAAGWSLRAGLAFLPFIAGVIAAANFVSNRGLERFGPKKVVPVGMILAAGAAGLLTGIGTHGGYGPWVAPALVLIGLGTGCVVTVAFGLGPAGARPADAGVAAALVNSSNQVGGSLGAALLNTIATSAAASYLAGHAAHPSPQAAAVHGDIVAFTFLVVLFAVGAVVTALLFPRRLPWSPAAFAAAGASSFR